MVGCCRCRSIPVGGGAGAGVSVVCSAGGYLVVKMVALHVYWSCMLCLLCGCCCGVSGCGDVSVLQVLDTSLVGMLLKLLLCCLSRGC